MKFSFVLVYLRVHLKSITDITQILNGALFMAKKFSHFFFISSLSGEHDCQGEDLGKSWRTHLWSSCYGILLSCCALIQAGVTGSL